MVDASGYGAEVEVGPARQPTPRLGPSYQELLLVGPVLGTPQPGVSVQIMGLQGVKVGQNLQAFNATRI